MPTISRAIRALCLAVSTLLFAAIGTAPVAAQFHESDAAAAKAFADLVRSYRSYQDLRCVSTVVVEAHDGSTSGAAEPVKAELIMGRVDNGRRFVLKMRGFTCWLGDGFLSAIHESNPHAYYRQDDAGAPYYALLSAFLDMPFPEFALAFGEESPEDVVMQLHPKAPWLRPTGLDRDAERIVIRLTSDHESAELHLDPMTQLPRSMEVKITGGSLVRAGTSVEYRHTLEHELPIEPFDAATLTFDPKNRQRTDSIAALPRRAPAAPAAGGGRASAPAHELVGVAAPPITAPTLDGPLFELAQQRGRIVVLDFWATWCGPCIAAMPHLHRIAAELEAEGAPVDFYTVNTFERFDQAERNGRVRTFWNDRKFSLPVVLDMDNAIARQYVVPAIPMTVVIGGDGVVSAVHVGFRQDVLIADIAAARAALKQPVE